MGPRIHSPSLVDEFVCDTIDGKDYAQATNEFVGKIASKFQADINIPFAYRNNVAMIMKRVLDGVPNDTQAQDLKHHITRRAILHHSRDYQGLCRNMSWMYADYSCHTRETHELLRRDRICWSLHGSELSGYAPHS